MCLGIYRIHSVVLWSSIKATVRSISRPFLIIYSILIVTISQNRLFSLIFFDTTITISVPPPLLYRTYCSEYTAHYRKGPRISTQYWLVFVSLGFTSKNSFYELCVFVKEKNYFTNLKRCVQTDISRFAICGKDENVI